MAGMRLLFAVVLTAMFLTEIQAQPSLSARSDVLVLATGTPTGLYYPVGSALCGRVNTTMRSLVAQPDSPDKPFICGVRTTSGSAENLALLWRGEADLALVQSDDAYAAYRGSFLVPAFSSLRSLFHLYSESVTVMVRAEDTRSIDDIASGRVALVASSAPLSAMVVGGALTKEREECKDADRCWRHGATAGEAFDTSCVPCTSSGYHLIEPTEMAAGLCGGAYDVVAVVVGHPAVLVQKVVDQCPVRFLSADFGDGDQHFISSAPHFSEAAFDPAIYGPNAVTDHGPVHTLGVAASVMTTADLPTERAYAVVEAVFEDLDALKNENAVTVRTTGTLTRGQMAGAAFGAPLHDGARAYFETRGYINSQVGSYAIPE